MTIKTILLSAVVTLGLAACHHDRDTNTPANNTYGTSGDNNAGQQAHTYSATPDTTTTPDVNGTGQSGAAAVQNGTDTNATTTGATTDQNTTSQSDQRSQAPGAINSTNNSAGNNSNNMNKSGARQEGTYNNSKNATPSSTNGTNVNTDSDMDRTGNSGTTKQGNPGTADQPDR